MSTEIKLTQAELDRIPQYIETWRKIGLNCDPCDFEKAKEAATRVYQAAGYAPPKYFHHARSPIEGAQIAMDLKKKYGVPADFAECLREQVYGPHDGHWFAYFDLLWQERKQPEVEKMLPLFDLAKVCGWWAAYSENCILQDRHSEFHFNDRDQLHNEEGPSIAWRDGVSAWHINGVEVDEQIVMRPETQTIEQMTKEENMEVKRLRVSRYGWDKYLTAIKAKKIDSRENPIEYTKESLYQTELGNILICACPSTSKVYTLETPPTVMTCRDAQKYLSSGLSERIISAS